MEVYLVLVMVIVLIRSSNNSIFVRRVEANFNSIMMNEMTNLLNIYVIKVQISNMRTKCVHLHRIQIEYLMLKS